MKILIEPCPPDDIDTLAMLWMRMMEEHRAFEPRLRLSDLAESAYKNYLSIHIRSQRSRVLVARDDAEIVGFICGYIAQNLPMFLPSEFGYISDLYVSPAKRGTGLGKKLVEAMHGWFAERKIACTQLQVYRANCQGREFWNRMGYEAFFDRMWRDTDLDETQ